MVWGNVTLTAAGGEGGEDIAGSVKGVCSQLPDLRGHARVVPASSGGRQSGPAGRHGACSPGNTIVTMIYCTLFKVYCALHYTIAHYTEYDTMHNSS